MILCLDVGNSQIFGGVFEDDQIKLHFRKNSKTGSTSDEYGLFLRSVLRENNIEPEQIHQISICSVVPEVIHSLRNSCLKYFSKSPFILQAGVKTGLKIKYRNPLEVGADRIANAISASHLYPNENLIVIDFGTATTFCAVTKHKEYLGGVIHAGLKISMQALETKTSRLPSVEIINPDSVVGRSTVESIQSGLYYGNLGMVKEIVEQIKHKEFSGEAPKIIATGGFASLFQQENVFDKIEPDLVLKGLYLALMNNV
ncbi:MAG: type III pantothenate kinase [Bdellovibrionaceae bacterium]|jgi:type III pantothenate kinase|nr:type III pantothenate kinase [Pseudobdellovibrionaceae bacterium]